MNRFWTTVALAALVAGCGPKAPPPEVVRPVQLTQVNVGPGLDSAVFAGEVKPRHEADLSFRIGGKVIARLVDVGAKVQKGQPLARLDPADVGLQTQAAHAQVVATETEYKFAQAEYDRYQNLFREKFISASALDAKRSARDAAKARFEQAQANLSVAQNQASYATLVANEDGVVTAVTAEQGQVVAAGQPVVRLARLTEREVAIAVPENRIGEVRAAQKLVVGLWAAPGRTYEGRVREIAPAVDPVTRTFAVRVTIVEPDPTVQWGMTANVGLLGANATPAAVVPLTAIYHKDGQPAVWRFDPASGQVTLAPVTIGQYREDGIVLSSGVANGDWIVAAGVHKLVPGQVVRPYESGPVSKAAPSPSGPRDARIDGTDRRAVVRG
ncbi:MAG: efflux RND transporter periplasmic adaptor subunit [Burkholderiales bacterium]